MYRCWRYSGESLKHCCTLCVLIFAQIFALCSPVSLLFVPRDPNYGVSKLAHLLSVLDKTMGDDSRGPYWTDNGRLEYKGKLLTSNKWLFEATFDGEKKVVVKPVRSHYGKAVHKLLAAIVLHPNSSSVTHYLVGGMLWCWNGQKDLHLLLLLRSVTQ